MASGLGGVNTGGIESLLDVWRKLNAPAPTVSFDKQLQLFAQTRYPLCWMAVPQLNDPSTGQIGLFGEQSPWTSPSADQVKELLLQP